MKQFFLSAVFLFGTLAVFAQSGSAQKVKWNFSSKKINDKTYEVKLSAEVDGDYHIYAQNVGVDGPIATSLTFNKNPLIILSGKSKEEGKIIKQYEKVWGGNVNYYEKKVAFVQLVQLKSKVKTTVGGTVEFMVCDDKQCLPPSEVNFKIDIGG
jgi:thiol:disulfide interchange protein DsbD